MHISLDSALGRDQRLNSLGETITSIAAPAAAYSLRSLTGGDPKVVRVRREGDNGEQDFTASEINSGALVDYINTNGVFANTGYESFSNASASGFTASNTGSTGFAVSDLPDGTSGTAISVSFDISITNGSPSISLRTALDGGSSASNSVNYTSSGSKTATLTATGSYAGVGFTEGDAPSNFTVSNFKILGDGFVETWYDQSGNGEDATQTTAASQPKIVNNGSLVVDSSNNPAIIGDGTDDTLANATLTDQLDNSDFLVIAAYENAMAMGLSGAVPRMYLTSSSMSYNTNRTITYTIATGRKIISFQTVGDTQEVFSNGSSLGTASQSQVSFGSNEFNLLRGGSDFSSQPIIEVLVYNSNQSSNRTKLETNIMDHYSIS
jgi:hypothetical protein